MAIPTEVIFKTDVGYRLDTKVVATVAANTPVPISEVASCYMSELLGSDIYSGNTTAGPEWCNHPLDYHKLKQYLKDFIGTGSIQLHKSAVIKFYKKTILPSQTEQTGVTVYTIDDHEIYRADGPIVNANLVNIFLSELWKLYPKHDYPGQYRHIIETNVIEAVRNGNINITTPLATAYKPKSVPTTSRVVDPYPQQPLNVEVIGEDTEDPNYVALARILKLAYDQAATGKGKERHAHEGQLFQNQAIMTLQHELGSNHFSIGQACKKSLESVRLPPAGAKREILGAIVYLAAAYLKIEADESKSS